MGPSWSRTVILRPRTACTIRRSVFSRIAQDSVGVFPRPLGNMATGVVTETGSEVDGFRTGDRVFGHWSIRETVTVAQAEIDLMPEGLTDEAGRLSGSRIDGVRHARCQADSW